MNSRALLCLIISIFLANESTGLSILVLQPVTSVSHNVWISHLVKELLRRGHQVHFVSVQHLNVEKELAQNYTCSVLEDVMDLMKSDINFSDWIGTSTFYNMYSLYTLTAKIGELLFATEGAKTTLNVVRTQKFDVIVQDVSINPSFYALWDEMIGKPPIVGVIPFGSAPWLRDYVGGSAYPDVRPYTHSSMDAPTNSWQRTLNYVYYAVDNLWRKYYLMQRERETVSKFIGKTVRPLDELEKSISVLLINSHSSFESAIPLPPNAIEIGGLHAQTVNPIRDQKLLKFLDEAKEGVLVVSLGTNVDWKAVEREKLEAIVHVFSTLKERILWKVNEELKVQLPKNVMTTKWLPQSDVLAHKNVKAIWTHAGLLSTHEAIWHGVPLIGLPFFMDQRSNIALLVKKGVAIHLDYVNISVESVREAVTEILHNPKYAQNMKKLSHEFRDRPVGPLDLAVWYVEHVARHPGRDFGYAGRFHGFVERNLIDVYAILLGSLISFLLLLRLTWKLCVRMLFTADRRKTKRS